MSFWNEPGWKEKEKARMAANKIAMAQNAAKHASSANFVPGTPPRAEWQYTPEGLAWRKANPNATQQQQYEASLRLNPKHKKDYSGSGVPTAHTGGSQAMPTDNTDLKKFFEWAVTPEGQAWAKYQQSANPPNPTQPSWVPEGYTLYGDDKTGVTLPTGTDVFDAMNRGGFNTTGAYGGTNPYFPNGPVSNGNLSLGGSPAETANPPTTGLYTPPKPPASGTGQSTGSGATSNTGGTSDAQLKAFLEYLAGRAGNASPIVGQANVQPAYTPRPGGPQYGAVTQKGLL